MDCDGDEETFNRRPKMIVFEGARWRPRRTWLSLPSAWLGLTLAAVGFAVGCVVRSCAVQFAEPPEDNGSQWCQGNQRQWLATEAVPNQREHSEDDGLGFHAPWISILATAESAFLGSPLVVVGFAGGSAGKPRMERTMASQFGCLIFSKAVAND